MPELSKKQKHPSVFVHVEDPCQSAPSCLQQNRLPLIATANSFVEMKSLSLKTFIYFKFKAFSEAHGVKYDYRSVMHYGQYVSIDEYSKERTEIHFYKQYIYIFILIKSSRLKAGDAAAG